MSVSFFFVCNPGLGRPPTIEAQSQSGFSPHAHMKNNKQALRRRVRLEEHRSATRRNESPYLYRWSSAKSVWKIIITSHCTASSECRGRHPWTSSADSPQSSSRLARIYVMTRERQRNYSELSLEPPRLDFPPLLTA